MKWWYRPTLLLLPLLLFIMENDGDAARHVLLEGVHLPLEKTLTSALAVVDPTPTTGSFTTTTPPVRLRFNGAGVRSVNMLGWDFKVYVAGFYASVPLHTAESVFAALDDNEALMQLDFTFLRAFDQGRVTAAWKQQLEHSVEHTYVGYEKERDFFLERFGPIENGGTETVQLLPHGRMVIIDQGVQKGVIEGIDFQKAFLSMWFGAKAVAADLKAGLLGKGGHFGLHPALHTSKESVIGLEG